MCTKVSQKCNLFYTLFSLKDRCRNQQCCLHFWLLLEDPFEQLSGIVKNVDRHGKPALFLIMPDSCLRIIQAKTKAVRRRKSVNNATISYTLQFQHWHNLDKYHRVSLYYMTQAPIWASKKGRLKHIAAFRRPCCFTVHKKRHGKSHTVVRDSFD